MSTKMRPDVRSDDPADRMRLIIARSNIKERSSLGLRFEFAGDLKPVRSAEADAEMHPLVIVVVAGWKRAVHVVG